MVLAGTVRNGVIVLDEGTQLPDGIRVRVDREPAEANGVEAVEPRFRELVRQWKEGTRFESSSTAIVMHPAYQQIIGLGREALPLIFLELRQGPDHWFWALRAITGENPIPAEDRGKLPRMTEAWLKWAEHHGY